MVRPQYDCKDIHNSCYECLFNLGKHALWLIEWPHKMANSRNISWLRLYWEICSRRKRYDKDQKIKTAENLRRIAADTPVKICGYALAGAGVESRTEVEERNIACVPKQKRHPLY
jgi:hypothetical protein